MTIEKLNIINFSGTKKKSVDFNEGINIIEGKNESGKSTITAFIKFMLYGFADKQERMRYYTFGESSASGTMTISASGKRYRIEREYTEGIGDKINVVNLETKMSEPSITSPGMYFLGVPDRVYTSSAYVGQAGSRDIGGEKMGIAIENMLFSGDESVGTEKALKKIDDARVKLYYKNRKGGKIFDMLAERDKLHVRLENAKNANSLLLEKEGSLRETKAKIEENKKKLQELSDIAKYYNAAKKYREIDRYNNLDDKAKKAEQEYSDYKNQLKLSGFYPSENLITKLTELDKASEELDEKYNKANYELAEHNAKAHEVQTISLQIEKVESLGGEEEIKENLAVSSKKIRLFGFLATMFLMLGIVIGTATAIFYFTEFFAFISNVIPLEKKLIAVIGAGIAVVFFILMVILFIFRSAQMKAINNILDEFEVDDRDDLDDILSKLNYSHVLLTMHRTKSHELREKIEALEREINALNEETSNILRPIGVDNLRDAIAVIMKSMANEEAMKVESEKFALARDTIGNRFTDEETKEITEILNGRPYDEGSFNESEIENAKKQYDFYSCSTELLEEKEKELEKEIAVLTATLEAPTELADELLCLNNGIEKYSKIHRALVLSEQTLIDAASDLRATISPRLSKRASELMSGISSNKYTAIGVGSNLDMEYTANDGKNHPIDYMSYGTREMAYICLRFALMEILFAKEKPSMIFDESFACIDNMRLKQMLDILSCVKDDGMQILLFTSQTRDAECASEQNVAYNYIEL